MLPSAVMAKFCWIYIGALVTVYLAKLNIITLDSQSNVVTPTLVGALFLSFWMALKVLTL